MGMTSSARKARLCICAAGIPCQAYHAGRPAKERSQVLEDWNDGKLPVVAATIAFGMGIDRAGESRGFRVETVLNLSP